MRFSLSLTLAVSLLLGGMAVKAGQPLRAPPEQDPRVGPELKAAEGDAPPPGYPSRAAILAAVATGRLAAVDMKPPLPEGVKLEADIEYGKAGDTPLLLDLYSPQRPGAPESRETSDRVGKAAERVPGLIFIHGGAWRGGKRQDYRVYTAHFASLGYVVATVSYRLVPKATFPAQIEDVRCAIRWMRSEAARIGVDPERIAVLGGSAGGHLSLLAAYAPGVTALEGKGCREEVSSRVAAVVDFYGPADLTTPFAQAAGVVKDLLGGKSFDEAPDLYRLASPIFHLTKDAPPTLILHGTIDETVPIDQSDALAARLEELGVPHEYARLEGWPHTMDAAKPVNDYCKRRVAAFLEKHLRTPR